MDCKYVGTKNVSIVSYHKYLPGSWQVSGAVIVKGQWMVGCCYWKSVEWLNVKSFSLSPVELLVPYQHSSKSKRLKMAFMAMKKNLDERARKKAFDEIFEKFDRNKNGCV